MYLIVDTMIEYRCSDRAVVPRHRIPAALAGHLLLACSVTEPEIDPDPDSDAEPAVDEVRTCLDPDLPRSKVPDFPLTYTTEHLDIYVDEERFLCAGTALEYERFVSYVSEQLGVEIQRRIPFYFSEHVGAWCSTGPGTAGCAREDGTIFSEPDASYHELTHGVACETRIGAPRMFVEGLATAFEAEVNEARINPKEFSELGASFTWYYYGYAGHFVRWLHEQLGGEALMDLYAHANYETGVWAAILAAYGDTAESDYLEQSPALWVPHRQCADLPLIEPSDDMWSFEGRFDCGDAATMGPYEREYNWEYNEIYQSFLIEIDEPGTYRFERPDPTLIGETDVYIERCLDEHPATKEEAKQAWVRRWIYFNFWWVNPNDIGWEELRYPGRWRVDVVRDYGPPVDVSLRIAREHDDVLARSD